MTVDSLDDITLHKIHFTPGGHRETLAGYVEVEG